MSVGLFSNYYFSHANIEHDTRVVKSISIVLFLSSLFMSSSCIRTIPFMNDENGSKFYGSILKKDYIFALRILSCG